MDEPLIYTSKGNVPIASLKYHHEWQMTDTYVQFYECYTDAAGDKVVESKHVALLKGIGIEATMGRLG